ncbi:MAG: hypothetical protein U0R26_07820 [Solirubrobacterales bacterium]
MRRRSSRAQSRLAGLLATLLLLVAALACAGAAGAAPRAQTGPATTSAVEARAEVARVKRYWTPARMRSARPLDLVVDGSGKAELRLGAAATGATASFAAVPTPEVPPFSVNGRIFVRQGKLQGYCSGTAINSPTRQLVLTAGHCVNSGPDEGRRSVWSNYLEFVPAYSGGVAPFGVFVAKRNQVHAPQPWVRQGNPDFDMGAFLTYPNSEGVNLADAVGGGATIVTDLTRRQEFQTFGYPGETKWMQTCSSPYIGDDTLTFRLPGPPTLGIRCRWAPGSSGGGWLIAGGTQIDGINTYLHLNNKKRTYGPYFSEETVGKLVGGL